MHLSYINRLTAILFLITCFFGYSFVQAEAEAEPEGIEPHPHHDPPKLVVGIMVDQMRPDYIYRYWEKFGDNGFRRIINDGFTFRNAFLDYYTASTAPGFASVYTGTTPSVHGIIANRWYSHEHGRWV